MLAQKGYIVWICDNRSASGRGLEPTWMVYKNLGELELRDLEDGYTWLKSQPYVDGSRIGLWGWSYGGFMTSYALTHSQTFKLGIAGGTVSDWRNYDLILYRTCDANASRIIRKVTGRAGLFSPRRICMGSCC